MTPTPENPTGDPSLAPTSPAARAKKTNLWTLTLVTYALVIATTIFAWWAYHHLESKYRLENKDRRVPAPDERSRSYGAQQP